MISPRHQRPKDNCVDQEHLCLPCDNLSFSESAKMWNDDRDREMSGEAVDTSAETNDGFCSDDSSSRVRTVEDLRFNGDVNQRDSPIDSENVFGDDDGKSVDMNCDGPTQSEDVLTKAKRARVENIVTNIKDKPGKLSSHEQRLSSRSSTEDQDKAAEQGISNHPQPRKRRMNEKIRKLQEEVAFLQKEYDCDYKTVQSPDRNIEIREEEEWNSKSKRFRISTNAQARQSPKQDNSQISSPEPHFRGAINVIVPQNGCTSQSDERFAVGKAYDVLVQSLKQELSSVLGIVVENSAKRVLEELQLSIEHKQRNGFVFQDETRKKDTINDNAFSFEKSRKEAKIVSPAGNPRRNLENHSSGFADNSASNKVQLEHGMKSSQIRSDQNICGSRSSSQMFSNFTFADGQLDVGWKSEDTMRNDKRRLSTSTESLRNSADKNDEQTEALSLVVRKPTASTPNSAYSTSPNGDCSFIPLDSKSQHSPYLHLSRKEADFNLSQASSASFSPESRSPERNRTPPASFLNSKAPPPFSHSFFRDANLYPPASNAFRHPLRHHPLTSPYRPHDAILSPTLMKPPPLPFYPTTNQTQSVYPFTSNPLPFPIPSFSSFHQGALANALADTYGRFRDNFGPGIARPTISTRTSTRENKTMGLPKDRHVTKADSSDFRSSAVDVSPYSTASIQEGLTPQHLKKAKLMFFYTRYPSANTLKTYFNDVKFSRATTSQLIKWFSNFREFYYIQMEKFARQVLSDGLTDVSQIQVTRDSELFRVLSLHYNKSNDYRVPEQFIKVSQKSLHEFFLAIQCGKDHDPAWKKVIYKVICKLDQEIPELFKSPNVLEHLHEI
ncbi:uncharacterized protein LOC143446657 isoform X2 [Clavelina lepadiformis]|uniref:uncharacterized protein LOC143446657 isoform X2 n=1 Tax=Clavelina lepadiformis TaxID=159417 RepID=UPI0040422D49